MKFIRFFSKLLIVVLIFFVSFLYLAKKTNVATFSIEYYRYIFPCSLSQDFAVGIVDDRFGISREDFVLLVSEAGEFWNKSLGKEIFKYDPQAQFKINLIFDERQMQTLEAQKLDQELKKLEISRETLLGEYKSLEDEYNQSLSLYNKMLLAYQERLNDYEKEIKYWNNNGGVTEDEYSKLKKERKRIEEDFTDLKKQKDRVNILAGKTNNLAIKENQIVNNYNNSLNTYKSEFGDSREFEKGVFSDQEINIYQFQKRSDLKLTLIHEIGHYLGLGHVENSKSVMYYLMGDQNLENPELTEEDIFELRRFCKMD